MKVNEEANYLSKKSNSACRQTDTHKKIIVCISEKDRRNSSCCLKEVVKKSVLIFSVLM